MLSMKNRVLIFTIVVLAFAAAAPAQTAKDAPELTRMLNEFLAGVNDPAVHDRFWAEDLIYTRSAGVRINKAELMKGMNTPKPAPKPDDPVTTFTAEDIRIQQYGSTAVVAFRLVSSTKKGAETKISNNLNTGVFVRRNKRWQVVAWQSTIIPPPK